MTAETTGFVRQISAVSPLEGDSLDGSVRPKARRISVLRPENTRLDASRTFFCRNPQCDHLTWSPVEQAKHMHREFVWAIEALILRAPDSPEALLLTGGVKLADMSDDECRAAEADYFYAYRYGGLDAIPAIVRLQRSEYQRRHKEGILAPAEGRTSHDRPRRTKCGKGHEYTPENTWISPDGKSRRCRKCAKAADKRKKERRRQQRRRQGIPAKGACEPGCTCRKHSRAKPSLPEVSCATCGQVFAPSRRDARYCSRVCAGKDRQSLLTDRACDVCGESYMPVRSDGRYCSEECKRVSMSHVWRQRSAC